MTQISVAPVDTVAGGRYRLLDHIGSGGVATVWRGHDELLDRDVAVKIVHQEAADPHAPILLLAEAKAAAKLRNPHIAEVYDVGKENLGGGRTISYVVMELVDGATLKDLVAPGTTLPWRQATGIIAQVAQALATAHARGITHRDISAANVMLTQHGVKVLDFGIAAAHGSPERDPDGFVRGSVRYTAPERVADPDRGVAPSSDIYSLGVLWYRLLTGRFPWTATNAEEVVAAHIGQPPNPIPDDVELPLDLRELWLRMLAKQPPLRPTAAEVSDRLSHYRSRAAGIRSVEMSASAVAVARVYTLAPPRKKRRGLLALIAAGVALLLAALFAFAWFTGFGDGDKNPGAAVPTPTTAAGGNGGGNPIASANASTSAGTGQLPTRPSESTNANSGTGATPTGGPPAPTGGTGGGGPGPAPSSSSPAAVEVRIPGIGGVVIAICTGPLGNRVLVLSALPNLGFLGNTLIAGPAKSIKVVFTKLIGTHTTEITATCGPGGLIPHVKES